MQSSSQDDPALLAKAKVEHDRIVGRFIANGRITAFPTKRKSQLQVLLEVVSWFDVDRTYDETEVNNILRKANDDVAMLRRALVDAGYVVRDHGYYRLPEVAPTRPAHLIGEMPDWERLWLPGYLAGSAAFDAASPS